MRSTVLGGAAIAGQALLPGFARRSWGGNRPRVAVFGAGFAGLTAAHELAERGFDVTLYERRAWGGKARSTEIPGSASGGRKPLPGEHSFRSWFGFYENTIDSFRKIPFGANPNGVFDNLVGFHQIRVARDRGRRDLWLPLGGASERMAVTPAEVIDTVVALLLRETYLQPEAVAFLGHRLAVYMSSCDARRTGQWENTPWADFAGTHRFNDDYRKILINLVSEIVQASKAEHTSANFSAHVLEILVQFLLGRGANGALCRTFDRPTNEALFDPWLAELERLGVRLRNGHEIVGLEMRDGRISAAKVRHDGETSTVDADWYVCAMPVERTRALWDEDILDADPELAGMFHLDIAWMNGMKLFLRKPRPLVNGWFFCVDSPWLVSGVSQGLMWPGDFAATYGDGSVHDCLSLVLSSWVRPGIVYGKPAEECTEVEIATEVWEQLKRSVNRSGKTELTDDMLHSWDIDPGMIRRRDGLLESEDPLVLPATGQYRYRPDVTTAIPNLFLAGDYMKSNWEVANMETASYNGRRAAQALVERSGVNASRVTVIDPVRPPEWEPLKRIDEDRYRQGLPNLFDVELVPAGVQSLLSRLSL